MCFCSNYVLWKLTRLYVNLPVALFIHFNCCIIFLRKIKYITIYYPFSWRWTFRSFLSLLLPQIVLQWILRHASQVHMWEGSPGDKAWLSQLWPEGDPRGQTGMLWPTPVEGRRQCSWEETWLRCDNPNCLLIFRIHSLGSGQVRSSL